jgi:glutathione synthase/RimK-type ligase-like ATP-grasp enzyme
VAVLVIAKEEDAHTQAVVREIDRLGGEYVVADLSDFPQRAQLNVHYGCCGERRFELALGGRKHDLDDFGAAWWRRPQHPQISTSIATETHRLFAANEAAEALAGLWHALDVFWVNDPGSDHVAHRKVTQLRAAQECGFRLPQTLITNDPDEAKIFIDRRGYRNVVYKAFSALEEEWRETRLLKTDELSLLDNVRYTPVIFQEYVEAVYDLRITVVGGEVFPAAIHSQQTSYPIDFRMDMANAEITAVEIPQRIRGRLRKYVRKLGLQYGAIDMRLRPDGEYVFLEINPAGQWLFVEEKTGQPIAAALARLLVEGSVRRRAVREGRVPAVEDESVAVGVAEAGDVADAGVDDLVDLDTGVE